MRELDGTSHGLLQQVQAEAEWVEVQLQNPTFVVGGIANMQGAPADRSDSAWRGDEARVGAAIEAGRKQQLGRQKRAGKTNATDRTAASRAQQIDVDGIAGGEERAQQTALRSRGGAGGGRRGSTAAVSEAGGAARYRGADWRSVEDELAARGLVRPFFCFRNWGRVALVDGCLTIPCVDSTAT